MIAKKILDNVLWRGSFLVTQFVINLMLARLLGASGSGTFNLLINNLAFFILVAGMSLDASITYLASAERSMRRALFFLSLCWPLLAAAVAVLLFHTNGGIRAGMNLIAREPWWAALYVAGIMWQTFFASLFYADQNFKTVNAILAFSNLAYILWLLALDAHAAPETSMLAIRVFFLLVLAQGIGILLLYTRQSGLWPSIPSFRDLRAIGRYGGLVLLNNFIFFLLYRMDYWLLDYFRHNDAELGNYIQVSKLGQVFMLLPGMLASVIVPVTAGGHQRMAARLPLMGRFLFSSYLMVLVLIFLFGNWLFPFLYGPDFSGMYIPFIFLSPGILALALHALLTAYFAGKDKVKINLIGSFTSLCVMILADLFLVPEWGSAGAAAGSSLGYFTYAAIVFVYFNKQEHIPFANFLVIRKTDIAELKNAIRQTIRS